MQTILIVGGGASGCLNAFLLSRMGYKVILVEKEKNLGTQTTSKNWFRQHMGPHYPTCFQTASGVLTAALTGASYLEKFYMTGVPNPEYYVSPHQDMQLPLIGQEGTLTPELFLEMLERLKVHYAELLKEYPEAEAVFGHPDHYYQLLDPSMPNYMRQMELGIRSNERLIDLGLFINSLRCELNKCNNVLVLTSTEITSLTHENGFFVAEGFNSESNSHVMLVANQVVQAAWDRGLYLDYLLVNGIRKQQGLSELSEAEMFGDVLHRIRVFSVVKNVEECCDTVTHKLVLSRRAASFGHLAPGVGILEATHLHTMESSTGLRPFEWDRILRGEDPRSDEMGRQIFDYCQPFFPFLENAEYVEPITATVISGIDLGRRSHEVLRDLGLAGMGIAGYHSTAGMKLSNVPLAAFTTLQQVMKVTAQQMRHDWGVDLSIDSERFMKNMQVWTDLRLNVAEPAHIVQMVTKHEQVKANTIEGAQLSHSTPAWIAH